MCPLLVVTRTPLAKVEGKVRSTPELDVSRRTGWEDGAAIRFALMPPFEVLASKSPLRCKALMLLLDVRATTSPSTSVNSIGPLDVRKSRLPANSPTRMRPFDVRRWEGPEPCDTSITLFDVVMRSRTALRGILTVKRAPLFPRNSDGCITRISTESGVWATSMRTSAAACWLGPYFAPSISTVSRSHPDSSTPPLKVSMEIFPPDWSG